MTYNEGCLVAIGTIETNPPSELGDELNDGVNEFCRWMGLT